MGQRTDERTLLSGYDCCFVSALELGCGDDPGWVRKNCPACWSASHCGRRNAPAGVSVVRMVSSRVPDSPATGRSLEKIVQPLNSAALDTRSCSSITSTP